MLPMLHKGFVMFTVINPSLCVCVVASHLPLEGREVDVRYEKDRLGLVVAHRLEEGHVVAFLEEGNFGIRNCEEKTQRGGGAVY